MKKRWIVFCAAALFAAGCASALDEAKAAPKTAVEKIRQLRETVDFNHAVRSHSMIDFSRGAFAGKIEKVLVNGKPEPLVPERCHGVPAPGKWVARGAE